MKRGFYISIALILFVSNSFAQSIIINEFSQGLDGSKEWVELLVTDNNQDIRGVYFTDDEAGFASAEVQLKTDLADFSNVSKGAIIVIYNASEKDDSLPADDIDFSDNVIIIPHTNTTFIESGSSWPSLSNSGEDFGIFASGGTGIHGISFGSGTPTTDFDSNFGQAEISTIEGGKSAYFIEDTPVEAGDGANWTEVASTSASPGTLNGGNNNLLPVELLDFISQFVNNAVELNWQTATEVNNYGFNVECRIENGEWTTKTFVPGNGTKNTPSSYNYTDTDLPDADVVNYRLKQIDNDGTFTYSKVVEVDLSNITDIDDEVEYTFALNQNYPNPFNPTTTISFSLPDDGSQNVAKLSVFNLLGQKVSTLVNKAKPAGQYEVQFNASNLPSGIYFYTLSYGSFIQTRKLLLMK